MRRRPVSRRCQRLAVTVSTGGVARTDHHRAASALSSSDDPGLLGGSSRSAARKSRIEASGVVDDCDLSNAKGQSSLRGGLGLNISRNRIQKGKRGLRREPLSHVDLGARHHGEQERKSATQNPSMSQAGQDAETRKRSVSPESYPVLRFSFSPCRNPRRIRTAIVGFGVPCSDRFAAACGGSS